MKIAIVIPVYNDWESFISLSTKVLNENSDHSVFILAVNDGSSDNCPKFEDNRIRKIDLNQNLGHQRAIAVGLCHVNKNSPDIDLVVVMDADGEDQPNHVSVIAQKAYSTGHVTFAQRKRRKESLLFRMLYIVYKTLFKFLVGSRIDFGNFCAIPFTRLNRVVSNPDLWNHFSGSIIKSKIKYESIPLDRGSRYFGRSKMNLVSLIIHGLSAISIQLEVVSVRIMLMSALSSFLVILIVIGIFIVRLCTDWLVPGWASTALLLSLILVFTIFGISLLFCLSILITRNAIKKSPKSYYNEFILNTIEKP